MELLERVGDIVFRLIVCVACYCVFDMHMSEKRVEKDHERTRCPDEDSDDVLEHYDRD